MYKLSSVPGDIAGLLFQGHRVLASVPRRKGLHLGERGGVPHPLDGLPVGHDVHVLHLYLEIYGYIYTRYIYTPDIYTRYTQPDTRIYVYTPDIYTPDINTRSV